MNNSFSNHQWFSYIETPHQKSGPVKLDRILAARMTAFMRARKVKPFKSSQFHGE